jgi:hypothetical protein
MKNLILIILIGFFCLPVNADQLGNIQNAIMFQTCMSQPIDVYPLPKKEKKIKVTFLPNGNIRVGNSLQQYAPVKPDYSNHFIDKNGNPISDASTTK